MNLLFGVPMSCIKIRIKKKELMIKITLFSLYSPYYTSFLIVVIDDIFVISEQQIEFWDVSHVNNGHKLIVSVLVPHTKAEDCWLDTQPIKAHKIFDLHMKVWSSLT